MAKLLFLAVVACSISASALNFREHFYRRYQEATAMSLLIRKKNPKAAQAAFAKLAATASTPADKAKWTAWEAIALGRQKGQCEAAMTLAKSIGTSPYAIYGQMEIMGQNNKWKELAEAFKSENLAIWPEDIKIPAYLIRGRALGSVENFPAAISDYENALAGQNPQKTDWVKTLSAIAQFQQKMGDDAKTLSIYRKMFDTGEQVKASWIGSSYYGRAIIAAAKILETQEKLDEALAVLTKHDVGSKSVGGSVRVATADLLAKMGRTDEAIVKYEEAIAFNDKMGKRFQRNNPGIKKKITALKNGGNENN